jgi:hypothetical protein
MNALYPEPTSRVGRPPAEAGVLELPLLLPQAHFAAVEEAARGRGQTAAQLVRDIIRDFLRREGQGR